MWRSPTRPSAALERRPRWRARRRRRKHEGALDGVNTIAVLFLHVIDRTRLAHEHRRHLASAWPAVGPCGAALGRALSVVYPKIGDYSGALWPSTRSIIAGARNVAGAHAYLDLVGGRTILARTPAAPGQSAARARMAEDANNRTLLPLTDAELDRTYRVD
jgi:hypothetical protein